MKKLEEGMIVRHNDSPDESDKGEDAVQPSVQKLLLECQSRWASQLQDFCQKHATGDIGRDVCDVTLELANKWRKQLAQERAARETAEKAAMHVDESEKERAERVERDFRAATGQEYEPGRDYERAFIKMSEYDRCFAALQVAREETKVAWRQYDKVSIPPKEPRPMSFFAKALKATPKYTALFVLFSALSSPVTYWESAKEWWNAPTQLELGDWTKVTSCDACSHVGSFDTGMCPKCGGEEFSTRKAQALQEYETPFWTWQPASGIRGYVFEDGSASLEPGNWELPE